jgi:beta-glucosidase
VLLKNAKDILPLKKGVRMYAEGLDAAVAARYGYVSTNNPDDAGRVHRACECNRRRQTRWRRPAQDVAAVAAGRRGGGRPGGGNQPVDLSLPAARLTPIRALMQKKPTIIVMQFDSPYVIPELASESAALLALRLASLMKRYSTFVMGKFSIRTAKLPLELPSSMEAVRAQAGGRALRFKGTPLQIRPQD